VEKKKKKKWTEEGPQTGKKNLLCFCCSNYSPVGCSDDPLLTTRVAVAPDYRCRYHSGPPGLKHRERVS
jgi:hypothetical protein